MTTTPETVADLPPDGEDSALNAKPGTDRVEEQSPADQRKTPDSADDTGGGRAEQAAAPLAPTGHVPLAERLPVQFYTDETFGQRLSHWGPTVTSAASILLTLFVWHNAQKLSELQIVLQRKQTDLHEQQTLLQTEQVEAELADLRSKFFDDLTATDENKKTLAEIGLAGHGPKAMHVVHLALGVEQSEIRKSAVNVVYRLFQSETSQKGRWLLLDRLGREFHSPNRTLRLGVVESLVKLGPLLDSTERGLVTEFLRTQVAPRSTCSDQDGRYMVFEAAKFSNAGEADFAKYLLDVARWPACGDGWLQAMLNIRTVAGEMPSPLRADMRSELEKIRAEVLAGLREAVDDKVLAEGAGFKGFMRKDQVELGVDFGDFEKTVEVEFDEVMKALSAP